MVSKEFLKKQLLKLQLNYGPEKFDLSKSSFELWYEMFSDCDEDGLRLAVTKCIKENEYAPNVAGLMKYYRVLEQEHKEINDVLKSRYKFLMSIWGEQSDQSTYDALINHVMRFPKDQRKNLIIEMAQMAHSFYNDCRNCGRQDIPTIKEYVEGKR